MDLNLNGRSALVLASSQGLGFATARGLALEGCNVAINGRDGSALAASLAELKEISDSEFVAIQGDVTDLEFSKNAVDRSVDALGGLDLLVTNAGGPPSGSFESFTNQDWNQAIELSFLCHVRTIREALPHLRQSPCPSVLTITSYAVKQPIPNLVLSNSVRAATAGLTKSLALELGREGIRFNSILPGWTKTERVKELMKNRAQISGRTVQEEIKIQMTNTPLGRMATPQEFANVAVFLLSPAAAYVTGIQLTVDGGAYQGTF